MSVISHDYDRAPAVSRSERRVYARVVRISCTKAIVETPEESSPMKISILSIKMFLFFLPLMESFRR